MAFIFLAEKGVNISNIMLCVKQLFVKTLFLCIHPLSPALLLSSNVALLRLAPLLGWGWKGEYGWAGPAYPHSPHVVCGTTPNYFSCCSCYLLPVCRSTVCHTSILQDVGDARWLGCEPSKSGVILPSYLHCLQVSAVFGPPVSFHNSLEVRGEPDQTVS